MAHVFISYARKDASALADRLALDVSAQHDPWLDRGRIQGGQEWADAIEAAIDRADVLLALLSGGSFESRICRAEHMRALRKGTRVIPLLASADADRPLYLEGTNFLDFSQPDQYQAALAQLLEQLGEGGTPPLDDAYHRTYVNAPPLPPHFVEPTTIALELRRKLLTDDASIDFGITALTGMGGIGKSSLALMMCHDPVIQDAFPDGVIWIDVGRERRGEALAISLAQLGAALGDTPEHYTALSVATTRVRGLLERRAVLVVLDDVWFPDQVKAFCVASPGCRILLTTRDESIALLHGAPRIRLGPLPVRQSLALLAGWAGFGAPTLRKIADRVGHHPLALKLAGIRLAEGISVDDWLASFDRVSRMRLGRRANGPADSVNGCIGISVEQLVPEDRAAVDVLGLFPEDVAIPAAAYGRLWRLEPGWDTVDAREFARELVRLGLAEPGDGDDIRLHDLVRGYLLENLGDRSLDLHRTFLQSYLAAGETWGSVPADGYIHRHIAHHLIGAERIDTLRHLCLDIAWLQVKLRLTGVPGILADLAKIPTDEALSTLHDALRLAATIVMRRPGELFSQLLARIDPASTLRPLLQQSGSPEGTCWLQPLRCDVRRTGGAELCAFSATSSAVSALTLDPDGSRVLSGHKTGPAQMWDVGSGTLIREIPGTGETAWRVAFSRDGQRVVTADESGNVCIHDTTTGERLRSFSTEDATICVALSPDDRFLVAGTRKGLIRLWNLQDDIVRDLAAADATGNRGVGVLAFTGDGAWLLATAMDIRLRVWRLNDLEAPLTLCNDHMFMGVIPVAERSGRVIFGFTPWQTDRGLIEVFDLATQTRVQRIECNHLTTSVLTLSPDGRRAAVAAHTSIQIYDLDSGNRLRDFNGHAYDVIRLEWPVDDLLVSADQFASVIAWDPHSGSTHGIYTHPRGYLGHLAVTPDGSRAVSSTWTGDIRVWRIQGEAATIQRSHPSAVWCVDIDEQSRWAASGDYHGKVLVWNLETGGAPVGLDGHTDGIYAVGFSGDGTRLLTASVDEQIRIWEVGSWRTIAQIPWFASRGGEVRWCADDKHIAAVAGDGIVDIWNVGEDRHVLHIERPDQCVWSFGADRLAKRLFVAWHNGEVRTFALPTGRLVAETTTGDRCYFTAAAVGEGLAVVKCEDGPLAWCDRLRVWDLETLTDGPSPPDEFTAITELEAISSTDILCAGSDGTLQRRNLESKTVSFHEHRHDAAIRALRVTPDRQHAITAGKDGLFLVWDLSSGNVLASYTADEPLMAAAISPDARTVMAGGRSGGIHLLRLQGEWTA